MPAAAYSAEQIDTIVRLVAGGASMREAGDAVGVSRNSVSSILFRLRGRNDPRVPAAGRGVIQTRDEQRDLLADAFAEGAFDLRIAAERAGLSIEIARQRWAEIRSAHGSQAR